MTAALLAVAAIYVVLGWVLGQWTVRRDRIEGFEDATRKRKRWRSALYAPGPYPWQRQMREGREEQ